MFYKEGTRATMLELYTLAHQDGDSGMLDKTLQRYLRYDNLDWLLRMEAGPRRLPFLSAESLLGLCIFQRRVQHGPTTDSLVSRTEPHSHELEVLRPRSEGKIFYCAKYFSLCRTVGGCDGEGTSRGGNDDSKKQRQFRLY